MGHSTADSEERIIGYDALLIVFAPLTKGRSSKTWMRINCFPFALGLNDLQMYSTLTQIIVQFILFVNNYDLKDL